MNRNRNQRVVLYSGRKLDHVIQEGHDPEFVKKGNTNKRANSHSPAQIFMSYGMYPRMGRKARAERMAALSN